MTKVFLRLLGWKARLWKNEKAPRRFVSPIGERRTLGASAPRLRQVLAAAEKAAAANTC